MSLHNRVDFSFHRQLSTPLHRDRKLLTRALSTGKSAIFFLKRKSTFICPQERVHLSFHRMYTHRQECNPKGSRQKYNPVDTVLTAFD